MTHLSEETAVFICSPVGQTFLDGLLEHALTHWPEETCCGPLLGDVFPERFSQGEGSMAGFPHSQRGETRVWYRLAKQLCEPQCLRSSWVFKKKAKRTEQWSERITALALSTVAEGQTAHARN